MPWRRSRKSQCRLAWQTVQLTVPICRSQSKVADTVLSELQNGQLKNFSSFGFCFFGGGLLLFRFPMPLC